MLPRKLVHSANSLQNKSVAFLLWVAFLQKASGKKSCAFRSFLLFRRKSYVLSPSRAGNSNPFPLKGVRESCKRKSFATTASLCNIGDIFLNLNSEEGNDPNKSGRGEQPRNTSITNTSLSQTEKSIEQRRVDLMLRLLTVMDGITNLKGVLIVTTSKNPSLLDPALLRPGRFERLIYLKLPNKKRRIELLKVQTSKIGYTNPMPWEYFGTRTNEMTGTEIASAINHSAFRAIIQSTAHTAQTLEYGISCVNDEGFTSYPFESSKVLSPSRQSNVGNKMAHPSLRIVRYASPTKSKSLALASLKHLEKPKLYSTQREIQLKELNCLQRQPICCANCLLRKPICVHNPYKPFLRDSAFACFVCRDVPCRALIPFRGLGKRGVRRDNRGHKLEASLFNKSTKNKIKKNFRFPAQKEKPWNGEGKIHYQDFRKYFQFGQNNNPNSFFSFFNKSNRDFLWSRKIEETLPVTKRDFGNWYRLYLPRTEQNKNNREWLYPDKFFNQHISLLNRNTFCSSLRVVPHKARRGSFFPKCTANSKLRLPISFGKKVSLSFFCTRSFFTKSYSESPKGSNFFFPQLFYKKRPLHKRCWAMLGKLSRRERVEKAKSYLSGVFGGKFLRKRSFQLSFSDGSQRENEPAPQVAQQLAPLTPEGSSRRGKALLLRKAKKKLCATFAQRLTKLRFVRARELNEKNSELSYHKLLFSCSYMSFQNCTENRELLDLLADHLIRFKLLRLHEIIRISSFYVDLNAL